MSDEMVGTEAVQPEGLAETPGPVADASASSPDPNDFDARLRSDPDFAVRFAKEQQSAATKANAALRKAELAIRIAETVGNGDVTAGASAALERLTLMQQMEQNPDMARIIERFKSGAPIAAPSESSSLYGTGYEEEDPNEKRIAALQGTIARLQERTIAQDMRSHLQGFMEDEVGGKYLTPEERASVANGIEAQLMAWAKTPEGRARFERGISREDIDTLGTFHLRKSGLLLKLGERAARQQVEQLRTRETDGPSRTNANGVPKASRVGELSGAAAALAAWREAKEEIGLQ